MKEPQTIEITIRFKVEHTPGNHEHLKQIAENYFRPKGVLLKDNVIEI